MTDITVGTSDLEGACPVCGGDVPRYQARWFDGPREVYECPTHGAIEYGPGTISLLEPRGYDGWLWTPLHQT
jgi:hypothetical protein